MDDGLFNCPACGAYRPPRSVRADGSHNVRTTISESRAEKMADAMVMRRLDTDRAYRNAKDAESQSLREAEISAQVWRELEEKYDIA